MKNLLASLIVLFIFSCNKEQQLSQTDTAEIVLISLYNNDTSTLKKHTTPNGYSSLSLVQNLLIAVDDEVTVNIIDESVDGEIAWVKYNTSQDDKPGVLKLIKVNNTWKVTSKGPREKGVF